MKKEKITSQQRRKFLRSSLTMLPATAVAVVAPNIANALPGAPGSVNDMADINKGANEYIPLFFQKEEFDLLKSVVDILIPEDDIGPGAIKAGVHEFIDRQMETPYAYGQLWYMKGPFNPEIMEKIPTLGYQLNMTPRDIYKSGIKSFQEWCSSKYNGYFESLSKEKMVEAIVFLSGDENIFSDDSVPSHVFFSQLLENTKEGFFADPMYGGNKDMVGWKMIGFPGARADFIDYAKIHNKKYPLPPVSIISAKNS